MSDKAFIANAKAAWQRVLDLQDKPDANGNTLAIAAALWASLNADRLIEIASRQPSFGPGKEG